MYDSVCLFYQSSNAIKIYRAQYLDCIKHLDDPRVPECPQLPHSIPSQQKTCFVSLDIEREYAALRAVFLGSRGGPISQNLININARSPVSLHCKGSRSIHHRQAPPRQNCREKGGLLKSPKLPLTSENP